ncbi:MAG: BamA/TamA family outer membrane protein [Trueperaceae bacterium]|nr:BamA/TamA family outer membrane protein [Trueperaceae bacterium]
MPFGIAYTLAQTPQISGKLKEVRVVGTTEANLIKAIIRSRPNTDVSQINLESERNLVLTLGIFSEVTVRLEDQPQGPVLVIEVEENPRINSVTVEGSSIASSTQWQQALASQLIEAGQPLNNTRAEEAITGIQQIYAQSGFPFEVKVALDVIDVPASSEQAENSVDLVYTVDESAPITDISYEGNTVLDQKVIDDAFLFLKDQKRFDIAAYTDTLNEIATKYRELGYRGSGVDTARTSLLDGQLNVVFKELRISALDTTAIGVSPSEFSLKVGDLFNYDVLLADIKRLSKGRDSDIGIDTIPLSTGDVRVSFRAGPPGEAGEITSLQIEGNTVVSTEEIETSLELGIGDNFTSILAQEDFNRIVELYLSKGYRIATVPSFNYLDGTYIQRVTELKIAGYEILFDKPDPKSDESTILRYLPKPGSVLNDNTLRLGLQNVIRQGAIEIQAANPVSAQNPEAPEEVIIQLSVRELPTARFQPGLVYETSATSSKFNANLEFSDSNFLGQLHSIGANLTAETSDIGFLLGASVSYSIPWLYIDQLDFKDVPTRIAASLFSNVETDQVLSSGNAVSVCLDPTKRADDSCDSAQKVLVGDYTKRDTGASLSVGRQILPFTLLNFSARGGYSEYKLEPGSSCTLNDAGELIDSNGNVVNGTDCALPQGQAIDFLPQSGLNAFVGSSLTYDNRDNANFPHSGISANVDLGVGFGSDYRSPATGEQTSYIYTPIQFGVRTYLQTSTLFPELQDPNHVMAFKVTAGHQFGADYPSSRYYIVGDSYDNDTAIRGYNRSDVDRSQTYAIGTFEYRYDFNFDSFATQTIIAYGFTDVGWASNVPGFDSYATPLLAGAGLGVQLNLGFSGINLPAIRLEYGFSANNPAGIFRFKVGPVF